MKIGIAKDLNMINEIDKMLGQRALRCGFASWILLSSSSRDNEILEIIEVDEPFPFFKLAFDILRFEEVNVMHQHLEGELDLERVVILDKRTSKLPNKYKFKSKVFKKVLENCQF